MAHDNVEYGYNTTEQMFITEHIRGARLELSLDLLIGLATIYYGV